MNAVKNNNLKSAAYSVATGAHKAFGLVEFAFIMLLVVIVVCTAVSVMGPLVEKVFESTNAINAGLGG